MHSQPKNFVRRLALIGLGEEKNYLLENLATLLAAGVEILAALDSIRAEMRSKMIQRIIDQIKKSIENGSPIWRALDESGLFASQIIALVRIGEESGRLSENLKTLVEQQQKDRAFHSKMRSAMLYPIFVLVLALLLGTGIAWFVLPRLAQIFNSLNLDLPWITKVLIIVGNFLAQYGSIVIPAFLLTLLLTFYFVFLFPKTKFIGQNFLFHLFGIKKVIREIELARFGFILGTLLQAGLPIVEALRSLADATGFANYKKFYQFLESKIQEGNSFQKSFRLFRQTGKLIPAPVQQMVVAGEQSGDLAEILIRIGADFEERTETTMKNFSVVLEPILLVVVWLGVVGIALAVILPIYGLIGGIN